VRECAPSDASLAEEEATMGHLQNSLHIDAPVNKVWDFVDDPHNWPTFMVGMSGPDKITGDGGVGTQYEFTMVIAGLHMHQTWRYAEKRRDPDGGGFGRGDIDGTASGWQTWDWKPEDGGTLVTMEMEYTVPGSVLGKLADRLVFEKMQDRSMRHGMENLKLLMEESPS
jgi:coenzyme Q-binding protein COQ10